MALTKVNTDLLEDGGKLDGIEALADVTDTTNVTAAGALMDSELTSEASVKALNQGVATTDSPTFAAVTANGGVVVDNFTLDGTTLALSSGDMTLDAAGRIDLSADDSGEIRFFDGSSMYGQIKEDDDRLKIQGLISNKAMLLVGNDGGSEVTMLSLDAENAGAATFSSTVTIGSNLLAEDIKAKGSGGLTLQTDDGVKRIIIEDDGDVVINETGVDADFRVESNSQSHMFFVDGGVNGIGIGTNSVFDHQQGSALDISYDGSIWAGNTYWAGGLRTGTTFYTTTSGDKYKHSNRQAVQHYQNSQGGSHHFYSAGGGTAGDVISWQELAEFDRDEVVFNNNSHNQDFRIESDTVAQAFTVDGATGQVGVGSRKGFRFGNASLEGNAGSSGGGYPVIGYNIRFQETSGQYGTLLADTSWRLDLGNNNRMQVHSRSAAAAVTGAATYTAGPYVALNGTSWTSSSDARLKENVNTITGAIDKVKAMNPVNFTWIHDDENLPQVGFIAQEMALVVPEVVDIPEDDEVHQGIQYEKLAPVLTAALQEALTKIENLEARIAALES